MRKILTLFSTFLALSKCDIENPGLVEPSKCEACKVGIIIFSKNEHVGDKNRGSNLLKCLKHL